MTISAVACVVLSLSLFLSNLGTLASNDVPEYIGLQVYYVFVCVHRARVVYKLLFINGLDLTHIERGCG